MMMMVMVTIDGDDKGYPLSTQVMVVILGRDGSRRRAKSNLLTGQKRPVNMPKVTCRHAKSALSTCPNLAFDKVACKSSRLC